MAVSPRYSVKFRRRREGKTDYSKRRKLLMSRLARLIVRKSGKYVAVQLVAYDKIGDKTLVSAHSSELKKLNWSHSFKNTSAAYLTGLLLGQKAKEKNISQAILDIGLYTATKGAKIFASLKGVLDAGLKVAHNPKILPSDERIAGKTIAEYLKKPNLPKDFENLKNKILKEYGKTKETV